MTLKNFTIRRKKIEKFLNNTSAAYHQNSSDPIIRYHKDKNLNKWENKWEEGEEGEEEDKEEERNDEGLIGRW